MKTFVTISAGVWLALSCAATSDARLHANWEGQPQSEPSNYNPDQDSQTSTRNLDRATTGLAQTLPSYESNWLNWFPITPLQAQAVSPKGMQERLSDPTLAGGGIQPSPHQAAVFGTRNQMAQEKVIAKCSPTITKLLPSWESKGFAITALELVIFGPNDVQERVTDSGGGKLGG